ncbi:MAG: iron ABC transporter permease [Chloroherpetonaceae bacterium]|nr:iron ABC transporter permease [Chloroherpetonaceae bacterium]MDW8437033.1 iron ABC transporter permease [Chloroherpetonaceae bacterium]
MFSRATLLVLNVVVLAVLLGYAIFPSFSALKESLLWQGDVSLEHYRRVFSSSRYLAAMGNSLLTSLLTVIGAGALGSSLAFLFWRYAFAFKRAFLQLFLLPIGLPPLVGAFSFQLIYGESGFLPRATQWLFGLSEPPFAFEGLWAVLLIHVYSFFVHFFLFVYATLSKTDYALVEAARTFGASRATAFRKILLPLLRPALVSASLITFALSMASFTAPLLFASKMSFLTVEIYNQKIGGEFGIASGLTVLLVLTSMSLLFAFETFGDARVSLSRRATPKDAPTKPLSPFGFLFLLGASLFVSLPILALATMSFSESPASSRGVLPTQWGVANYAKLFGEADFYEPFLNSFSLSLLASAANLLFGVIAGTLIASRQIALRPFANIAFLLPLTIPATALGVNLIATFNKPSFLAFGQTLVGTVWILPLAYFIRHLPYVTRSVSSALSNFDPSLSEAAATLGASPARALWRVAIPIALSAIASGFLFTFISAFGEFPCSVLLYSPDAVPISVAIFSSLRLGEFGVAAAQGVLLLLVVTALTATAQRLFRTNFGQEPFGF